MRKNKNKPIRRSFEDYIQNEGRQQHYAYLQAQEELAKQESSNRTEERKREDAERSVRKITRQQDRVDDAEYDRTNTVSLVNPNDDTRSWFEKTTDDVWIAAETGYRLFEQVLLNRSYDPKKAYNEAVEHVREHGINRRIENENKAREKAKQEFLSKYTPEAYAQAKLRADQKNVTNLYKQIAGQGTASLIAQDGIEFDQLDRDTQASIAKRELEYRSLISPSDDTITMAQQAMEQYSQQQLDPKAQPEGYFDPEIKHDRHGRIYYGMSPWMKDWWSQSMQNMNTAQRDNFIGMGLRYDEKKQHALNAQKYYQAQNDLIEIPKQIDLLNKYLSGDQLTDFQKKTIDEVVWTDPTKTANQVVNDLKSRLTQAYGDNMRYRGDAEWIESYDPAFSWSWNPKTLAERLIKNIGANLESVISKGFEDWQIPAYTSGLTDEVGALDKELSGLKNADYRTKIQLLNKFIKEGDRKSEFWKEGARVNQEDIDNVKQEHEPSEYFKYRMQTSDGAFYKPSTWMYKMPEVWGSSQSSWMKQTTAMGLNAVAALASGGWSLAAGGAGFGLAMSSSSDENNAEVAENYRSRLKQVLQNTGLAEDFVNSRPGGKKSLDESIEEYVMSPWELGNRKLDNATFEALHGVNSLYQDDMAAVTGDNIVDTYLQISPLAGLARAAKPSSALRAARKWGSAASMISPVAGATAYATSAVTTAAGRKLMQTAAGKAFAKQTQSAVNFTKKLPKRLL